jgi:hypothetical protein
MIFIAWIFITVVFITPNAYLKKWKKKKRAGGVAQAVMCLCSKSEAQGSYPGTTKKKNT